MELEYNSRVIKIWVWRSLVACLNGVQEAGSSSLPTQTKKDSNQKITVFFNELPCGMN